MIWNLILNAVQAMPDGGALTVEAYRLRTGGREGVQITIHDTGCGISEENSASIFEPFYTTRGAGTGLGLTVVNRILDEYSGTVAFRSEPEKGTTFSVWLPIRAAA